MWTVRYYLDCRRTAEGEKAPLKIMITKDRKSALLSTSLYLKPEDWLGDQVKNDKRMNYLLEQRLASIKAFVFDIETKGNLQN